MTGYNLALKKKKSLSYATTWIHLEDMMLSYIVSHSKINTAGFHLYEVSEIVELFKIKKLFYY